MRALPLLLLAACFEEEDPSTHPDTTGSTTGVAACEPFEPEVIVGSFDVAYDERLRPVTEPFTAPAGGRTGLLLVELASATDGFSLGLRVDDGRANGFGVLELEDGDPLGVLYALSPGTRVDMIVDYVAKLDEEAGDLPGAQQVAWSFTEVEDCWEPNDQAADAPAVPVGEDLTAWMVGGLGGVAEERDWYRFTAPRRGTVTLTVDGPDDLAPALGLQAADAAEGDWLWDGANAFAIVTGERGRVSLTWEVEPGDYRFLVEPFVGLDEAGDVQGEVPPHLLEPYTFRVELD